MTSPASHGLGHRAAFPLAGFQPALLLGCVVVYTTAFLFGRAFPASGRSLLVLLAPLLVISQLPHRWDRDRMSLVASALMLGFVAWSLLQLLWVTPLVEIGAGRCAVMAAAIVLCWSVMHGPTPAEGLIAAAGVSTMLALAVAIVGMRQYDTASFGLGNINHLLYCCTPAFFGWVAWLVASALLGRRTAPWQWLLAAVTGVEIVYASVFATPGMPRRGAFVAGGAAALGLAAMWLWSRSRRACIAAIACATLAAGGALAWQAHHHHDGSLMARTERVQIYRAAMESIPHSLPWGAGLYGSLGQQDLDGEANRHLTSTGLWLMDVHNQLLESFLDGGIVGGLLFIALVVTMWWRTSRIADPALRYGAAAIGVVLLVHGLTDNCYGMPAGMAWAGVLFGIMLSCPVAEPDEKAPIIPGLRLCAWIIVGFCTFAATREMSATFMSYDASTAVRMRTLRQTWQADLLGDQWRPVMEVSFRREDMAGCRRLLDLAGPRLGWTSGQLAASCMVDERMTLIALNEMYLALGAAWREPDQIAAVGKRWRQLAEVSSADRDQQRDLLRLIHRFPMGNFSYAHLDALMSRRPDLEHLVPAIVKTRMAYRSGSPDVPAPRLEKPGSIEMAADLYSEMLWANGRKCGPERLSEPLRWLLRSYGDIDESQLLALLLVRDAEPGAYAWLIDEPAIIRGFSPSFTSDYLTLLDSIDDPVKARVCWPLLARMNPEFAHDIERGHLDLASIDAPATIAIWERFVRIHALAISRPAPAQVPR